MKHIYLTIALSLLFAVSARAWVSEPEDLGWALKYTDSFFDGNLSFYDWPRCTAAGVENFDGFYRKSLCSGTIYSLNDCNSDDDYHCIVIPNSKSLIAYSTPFKFISAVIHTASNCQPETVIYSHFGLRNANNDDYIRVSLPHPDSDYPLMVQADYDYKNLFTSVTFENSKFAPAYISSISYLAPKEGEYISVENIGVFKNSSSEKVSLIDEDALVIGQHGSMMWVKGVTSGICLRLDASSNYDLTGRTIRAGFGGAPVSIGDYRYINGVSDLICPVIKSASEIPATIAPEEVSLADLSDQWLDKFISVSGVSVSDGYIYDSDRSIDAAAVDGYSLLPLHCDVTGFLSKNAEGNLCMMIASQSPRSVDDGADYLFTDPQSLAPEPSLNSEDGNSWTLDSNQKFTAGATVLTFASDNPQSLSKSDGVTCDNSLLSVRQQSDGEGILAVILTTDDEAVVSDEVNGLGTLSRSGNVHSWLATVSRAEGDLPAEVSFNITGNVKNISVSYRTSKITTSLDEISVAEAAPRYFNLQGVEVSRPTTAGIYIERRGRVSRKIIIR